MGSCTLSSAGAAAAAGLGGSAGLPGSAAVSDSHGIAAARALRTAPPVSVVNSQVRVINRLLLVERVRGTLTECGFTKARVTLSYRRWRGRPGFAPGGVEMHF